MWYAILFLLCFWLVVSLSLAVVALNKIRPFKWTWKLAMEIAYTPVMFLEVFYKEVLKGGVK